MRRVTVSKLQIAQAEQCVERLDKYTRLLDISIEILKFAKAESQYNQLPEEFKMVCRRDLEIVMADLKSLKNDAQEMALLKAEKTSDLRITRNKQLKEVKMINISDLPAFPPNSLTKAQAIQLAQIAKEAREKNEKNKTNLEKDR